MSRMDSLGSNESVVIDRTDMTMADIEEEMMCAELNQVVGNYLASKRPGYPWGIESKIRHGLVNIFLSDSPGNSPLFGAQVKIQNQHQLLTDSLRYADELLERAGLRRGKMNADEYGSVKRRFDGRMMIDES